MANTNYTLQVHTIRKNDTSGAGAVIIELDGKLSAQAKRDLREAINEGAITVRESVRTIA